MLVSVVIPVYNAEKYLKAAVESALSQRETGEVILVEDNSPDGSLQICRELEATFDRVRVVRHPGGQNLGAGASRNLGVQNAKFDYLAFLDADDYYLEHRFTEAHNLFKEHEDIDGVYEAVGVCFQDSRAKEKWLSSGREELTTMNARLAPQDLLRALLEHGRGWLHLNGLVVRKDVLDSCGLFFEHLRLHQDSAFFIQLAASCRLYPGRLSQPVAMRRVHDHNRISSANPFSRALYFKTLLRWARERRLEKGILEILFYNYFYFYVAFMRSDRSLKSYCSKATDLFIGVMSHPYISLAVLSRHIRQGIGPVKISHSKKQIAL